MLPTHCCTRHLCDSYDTEFSKFQHTVCLDDVSMALDVHMVPLPLSSASLCIQHLFRARYLSVVSLADGTAAADRCPPASPRTGERPFADDQRQAPVGDVAGDLGRLGVERVVDPRLGRRRVQRGDVEEVPARDGMIGGIN